MHWSTLTTKGAATGGRTAASSPGPTKTPLWLAELDVMAFKIWSSRTFSRKEWSNWSFVAMDPPISRC